MRFPEFTGEWIKYRVSDLLEFFPTNSLSWDQLRYDIGDLYNLHYGIIHKGASTQIDTDSLQLPSIRDEFTPKTYTLCKDGDVVFADASEDTNDVAKVVEFYNCGEMNIVSGLHTIHGRDKLNLTVKGFKGYIFSSAPFRRQIKQLAQGAKVYSVSPKNFNECFVGVPSKEEQVKVANLLRLLDDRIATQSQIIKELKSLKNVLSYELIYNNRMLDGKVKLADIGELKNGYAFSSKSYRENGKYKIITISNVAGDRNTNTAKCNTITDLPKDLRPHQILKIGDILISLTGNVGRVSLCDSEDVLLNQRVGLFIPNNSLLSEFAFQAISNKRFENMMIANGKGAAQMNISKSDIDNYEVPYSTNDTLLLNISLLLRKIDIKINTEINQYDLLIKQKKYLMNQMFI